MFTYLGLLVLTISLEAFAMFVVASLFHSPSIKLLVPWCICLNLVTHPLAGIACGLFGMPLLPVEVAVTVIEGLGFWFLAGARLPIAVAVSLVTNAVSFVAGLVLAPIV